MGNCLAGQGESLVSCFIRYFSTLNELVFSKVTYVVYEADDTHIGLCFHMANI